MEERRERGGERQPREGRLGHAGGVRTAAETSGHEPGVNTHGLRLMKQARVTDANTHTHTPQVKQWILTLKKFE